MANDVNFSSVSLIALSSVIRRINQCIVSYIIATGFQLFTRSKSANPTMDQDAAVILYNDPKSWGRPIVGSFITLSDWIAI